MTKKMNNKGLSLIELIVAIAIMVVMMGILTPTFFKYYQRAKQVRVEKEASEFIEAARLAYIETYADGIGPSSDVIKHRTVPSSPYYKGGLKYGNLTNWTVHNGTVAGASNGAFAKVFFDILGIKYGSGWNNGSSSIPISASQPKLNPAGSMNAECIFQVFYSASGDMIVEYSRNGYFVRMYNSSMADSIKIQSSSDRLFTSWQ